MLDRIRLLLETQNLTASQFAARIDVQRSSVSHIMSGRNKASLDFVQKILKSFPEISPDWLINGEGPMLRKADESFPKASQPNESQKQARDLFEFSEARESSQEQEEKTDEQFQDEAKPTYGQDNHDEKQELNRVEKVIIFYKDGTFQAYSPGRRNA